MGDLRLSLTKNRESLSPRSVVTQRLTHVTRRWLAVPLMLMVGSLIPDWACQADDEQLTATRQIDFPKQVLPILQKHCWKCHGAEKQEAGLRLDSQRALDGGDSGRSIIPGKSAASPLIHRVSSDDQDEVMPPEGARLSSAEIAALRTWIDQGAVWPDDVRPLSSQSDHWSYRPIVRPTPPTVKRITTVKNPIDAFVLSTLESHGVEPSPEADRYALIRRLSLDLLGLPPAPEDVDAFLNDRGADAYEGLVNRLLQSPHYGERWGRHWLDMARYADSDGYEKDNARPDAWRWREWVIDTVNADMPFDQFTIEQLAGDLLPNATDMQRLATAFHRQTLTNTEGGVDKEEFRVEACFDRVETIGTVWLGLTVGCARCHSHKYEPISQREYFQLFAFVNNGDETTTDVPLSDEAARKYERDMLQYTARLKQLEAEFASAKLAIQPELPEWETKTKSALQTAAPVEFHVLEFETAKATSGAAINRQPDGSYLVEAKTSSDKDEYTLSAKLPAQGITAIRVETIPDPSLPGGGAGRASNGNFVLSDLRVYVGKRPKLTAADAVAISSASADFSQQGFLPANAFDSDKKTTGWAVAPEMAKPHAATFLMKPPSDREGATWIQIVLDHQYGGQHTLGRFRISVRTGMDPRDELTAELVAVLNTDVNARQPAEQQLVLDLFARQHEVAGKVFAAFQAHKTTAPKPPFINVRVISERTAEPRTTYLMRRGSFLDPLRDQQITPATLNILPPIQPLDPSRPNRIDLAKWLISRDNPLTPRVAVNHVWKQLFGEGLVRTPNDFGVRGEKPSHPELLDWLACEFRDTLAWSRKRLIKLIVMSATYRQASAHRPELSDLDPLNLLLARQNRIRVEGEIVRDLALAASGLLSRKVGGPSVFPPLPAGISELSYANNFKWAASTGEDRYRRGMYTFFKRTAPHPNLTTFDCPDANLTCVKRQASNTPLQSLVLLNNDAFFEAAQALGRRLRQCPLDTDAGRLELGFRLCTGRPMNGTEATQFAALLDASRSWYAEHPEQAKALVGSYGIEGQPQHEVAAWIATSRILLNLDEFITRN